MALHKLFYRETSDTVKQHNDILNCDDIGQLLIKLIKLIEYIKADKKLSTLYIEQKIEFDSLQTNIDDLNQMAPNVYRIVDNFDFKNVKFNGYRSFFNVIKKCIKNIYSSLQKLTPFRWNRKVIKSQWFDYCKCLDELTKVSKCIYKMMLSRKDSKNLFMKKSDDETIYLEMMDSYNKFDSEPFYGQCLGFYLCESSQIMTKIICSIQLGLGQAVSIPKSSLEIFVATVVNSANTWYFEKKRGSQMCNLFNQATITFCKQFWNLVDHPILVRGSNLVFPHLKIIKPIKLEALPILMSVVDNSETVKIMPPVTDSGYAEVNIRLLSNRYRDGMSYGKDIKIESPSKCVLIHCHGGGFVAQSSQSHDGYLRQWAIDLDCPIVSIDYSHAPEYPFPRAHEECFYSYCWVLQNFEKIGCDLNCKVVICGDSAGGNLALGCVVRSLQLNIRIPDAVFVAYPAALVDLIPTPARILGALDPILPMGVLARCLLAYSGINEDNMKKSLHVSSSEVPETGKENELEKSSIKVKPSFWDHDTFDSKGSKIFYSNKDFVSPLKLLEKADINNTPLLSPLLSSDDIFRRFPPISVVASEFDPLLDDSVELCKRIDNAGGGQFVKLQVMPDLQHGFLNMASPITKECVAANKICVEEIRRFLAGDYK